MSQTNEPKSEAQQSTSASESKIHRSLISRPLAPFRLFAKENSDIKDTKFLSKLWHEIDAFEKEKFNDLHKKQKEVYKNIIDLTSQKEALIKQLEEVEAKLSKANESYIQNPKQAAQKTKRSRTTPFNCYYKSQILSLKEKKPELKYRERAKELRAAWKEMGEEERKPYIELAKEARKVTSN
ncbi:unnamed protein product [Blepharisma stoltei]|uniref:HMG box domain-containing protein n=1 Tax=Blepharisma stoltei TaxID=1481888 RepID=A0AAU9JEQ8_9CILI|nr:unnamed protein product [Blepharisma stoltei]